MHRRMCLDHSILNGIFNLANEYDLCMLACFESLEVDCALWTSQLALKIKSRIDWFIRRLLQQTDTLHMPPHQCRLQRNYVLTCMEVQ